MMDSITYLLAQLHPCVHNGVSELVSECKLRDLHFLLVKKILETPCLTTDTAGHIADTTATSTEAGLVEEHFVVGNTLNSDSHTLYIVRSREHCGSLWVQLAEAWVKLLPVCLRQLGTERIEGDVDAPAVGLKLQDFRHDVCSRCSGNVWARVDPLMEVLEVVLVQGVADNLNVEFVEILVAERALEVGRERCLNQDGVVQFLDIGRHAQHRHGLEPTERVTPFQQLARISLMQRTRNQQRDIVDHVSVREIFHELGKRAGGVGLEIAELGHELVGGLRGEGRRRRVRGQVVEEVTVRGRELQLDIYSIVRAAPEAVATGCDVPSMVSHWVKLL